MDLPVMSISYGLGISMQKPGTPQRIALGMWDTDTDMSVYPVIHKSVDIKISIHSFLCKISDADLNFDVNDTIYFQNVYKV